MLPFVTLCYRVFPLLLCVTLRYPVLPFDTLHDPLLPLLACVTLSYLVLPWLPCVTLCYPL